MTPETAAAAHWLRPRSPTSTPTPSLELVLGTINRGLAAYDIQNSAQRPRILWGTGRGSYARSGLAPAAAAASGSLEGSYKVAAPRVTPAAGETVSYTIRVSPAARCSTACV